MVTNCNKVADVGCDHAYTSIYLVRQGVAKEAIAMDLRSGPLSVAQENICKFGLVDKIEPRLSDGLKELQPGEADVILIAGMGGELIIEIINAGEKQVYAAKELIIQPQSELSTVRHYLHTKGFTIVSEDMCEDNGKFYVTMKAIPPVINLGKMLKDESQENNEEREIFYTYGKLLIMKCHPILHNYLKREYNKGLKIINQLESSNTQNAKLRLPEYLKEFALIKQALQWFEKFS